MSSMRRCRSGLGMCWCFYCGISCEAFGVSIMAANVV